MQGRTDAYLSAAQLGITVASLGLGWVGEPAFARLLEPLFRRPGMLSELTVHTAAFGTAFVLITFLHILVGEQAPKLVAVRHAEKSILAVARSMRVFYYVLYVPLTVLNGAANQLLRWCRVPTASEADAALTEEELRLELVRAQRQGEVSLNGVLLSANAMDMHDLTAAAIMVPLAKVVMLDVRRPWAENREIIRCRRLSRYPLCDGDARKPLGFVHLKDLALARWGGTDEPSLSALRRELPRVQESLRADDLLRFLQRQPSNMALVEDGAGMAKGIVTFEDVIEELVGEVADEFTPERPWRLGDCLVRDAVLPEMRARDPESAVHELAVALSRADGGLDASLIVGKAMHREAEGPTLVGNAIALPHARLAGIQRSFVAYGRCRPGMDCGAPDGLPVRHIILIVTPLSDPKEQLRALARIARIAMSPAFLAQLEEAQKAQDVVDLVLTADVAEAEQ
jgi:mannitol/fructose-specific phosphotransferase system IIA component (Ntr-type)